MRGTVAAENGCWQTRERPQKFVTAALLGIVAMRTRLKQEKPEEQNPFFVFPFEVRGCRLRPLFTVS